MSLFVAISCDGESHAESVNADEMNRVTSFEGLVHLASSMSSQEFVPREPLPQALADLTYEEFCQIQFRHKKAVWWETPAPYWIETFHRGFVQQDCVSLFTIENSTAKQVPFSSENFDFGEKVQGLATLDVSGHAGIKIVGRFPGFGDVQEILTFLGSSYFRGRSGATAYGASARGLAVDISLPRDEEFPFFKAFWIVKPEATDEEVTLLALMDSPSVCGAYEFKLVPGSVETKISVKLSLHFRKIPEKIGIAPLTSMWIWGDGLQGPPGDKRPAVHDSDGLIIRTADDEWIWRTLARQSYPSVSKIYSGEIRGFGLLQRNRSFYHFDDHNAHYHKRPSVWIEPKQNWKNGSVELLELPGAHEGIDSIAAYWIPDERPQIGVPLTLEYDVLFFPGDHSEEKTTARATDFSIKRKNDDIDLTVRFSGVAVKDLKTVSIQESFVRGELVSKSAQKTDTGDWLVTLRFRATEAAPIELGVTLMDNESTVSERFMYLCPDKEPSFVYPEVYTRSE